MKLHEVSISCRPVSHGTLPCLLDLGPPTSTVSNTAKTEASAGVGALKMSDVKMTDVKLQDMK